MRFEPDCPFRRSRESAGCQSSHGWTCFNSLRAGGSFRPTIVLEDTINLRGFQFPTSGKGHSDTKMRLSLRRIGLGFNSLRAGRDIQTINVSKISVSSPQEPFQFPTSGKGHSDNPVIAERVLSVIKVFQFPTSGKGHSDDVAGLDFGFNGLGFQFPTSGKGHSDFRGEWARY